MKIFITGVTGFVGSHLAEFLNKNGHQVYALVRDEKKFKELNLPVIPILGQLQRKHKHEWLGELPPDLDAVIHTAGVVHSFSPKDFYDTNARATKRLIKDLKALYPHNLRFCLISSLAAAGPSTNKIPRTEDLDPAPVSHYGHSKHLGEMYFSERAPSTWKKTIIRPPAVMGPRDPAFLDVFQMVKGGIVIIPGFEGLHKEFSFICVHDLVDSIYQALQLNPKKTTPEVFFVGHPRPFTYSELIARITKLVEPERKIRIILPHFVIMIVAVINRFFHRLFPKSFNFRLTPDKAMELNTDGWVSSSSKADGILSLNYKWNFEQTLQITYDYYKKTGKL